MSVYGIPDSEVARGAALQGPYRYYLERDWTGALGYDGEDWQPRTATFIMLNPSTADALVDDPTIRRCVGFARALGCTALWVGNLYNYRATKPADLWRAEDPVGGYQANSHLAAALWRAAEADSPVIAAWGAHGKPDRVAEVLALPHADRLTALRVTKSGAPEHPLYLPATARPVPWPG